MREQESVRIREILGSEVLGPIQCVLELGASERVFRETHQPHILRNIHEPLAAKGIRVVTTDLKDGDGIDISGDLYDRAVQAKLAAVQADVVLCCNVFEHLSDREGFAKVCDSLVAPGRHLLITVPRSYPFHPDPIDTLYRPEPEEIAALFPGYTMLVGEVIEAGSYRGDIRRGGSSLGKQLLRTAVRSLYPWRGLEAFKAKWHRWAWIGRPFKISLVLLRK